MIAKHLPTGHVLVCPESVAIGDRSEAKRTIERRPPFVRPVARVPHQRLAWRTANAKCVVLKTRSACNLHAPGS